MFSCTFLLTSCTHSSISTTILADSFISARDHSTRLTNQPFKSVRDAYIYKPIILQKEPIPTLSYQVHSEIPVVEDSFLFPESYTELPGIYTFRGNHLRTAPAYGTFHTKTLELASSWTFQTNSHHKWGGGAGWTGQPSIVKWDQDMLEMMNVYKEFKKKDNLVEVIYGSLDGSVYFLDLETGKKTRDSIYIGGPIKGSVTIDPRGYPLLYVGQGIPDHSPIGYRIFSLLNGEMLHFIEGIDSKAYRKWGAFDGSALINRETDQLIIAGENGLFYKITLHTQFDKEARTILVEPKTVKWSYQIDGNPYQGIENSVSIYKNIAYFADNGGSVIALDLQDMQPIFALPKTDDTDATIVIEPEQDIPMIYTGTEVDHQGSKGNALIRKIHGLTGKVMWKTDYPAYSIPDVNGGVLATPIIGKNDISELVIFSIARYNTLQSGLLVALNKETGEEIWKRELDHYAWSSPIDVYSEEGTSYIVQAESAGNIHFIEGSSGKILDTIHLNSNIEATPAIYENKIVVANRGGEIHCVVIQ